jgi:hypothetical protein
MNKKIGPYHVIDLPPERRMLLNIIDEEWRKHFMYGLLEVDVTVARKFIMEHKARTGELLSFTGYLTVCLARAVDENKAVQVCMKGRKQLVVFDDVDVGLMIERQIGERHVLMGHVVRGANHKTYQEIHQEIRSVQSTPVPPSRGMDKWFGYVMSLSWPLSGLFKASFRVAKRLAPVVFTSMIGTVGITSLGMFAKGQSGWGLSPVIHGLALIVGSITWKPAVVEGRIEPREILNLTVAIDHDVIDGAPATRFVRRLVELIESGYGLEEDQTQPAVDTEPAAV